MYSVYLLRSVFFIFSHWPRLVKNIGGANPNFGEKCGENW